MRIRWEWGLAVLAPLTVVLGLLVIRQVLVVFLVYHLGICLVVPWLVARHEGRDGPGHRRQLGLRRGGRLAGPGLGILLLGLPLAARAAVPDLFPDTTRLAAALAHWGLDPARPGPTLSFLALVNGPAEELFWRGWLQTRIGATWRALGLLALLFTSYHVVTIGTLAPTPLSAGIMLAGVLLAALFWSWTRRRWQTVWIAILAHTGAAVGYVLVALALLARAS